MSAAIHAADNQCQAFRKSGLGAARRGPGGASVDTEICVYAYNYTVSYACAQTFLCIRAHIRTYAYAGIYMCVVGVRTDTQGNESISQGLRIHITYVYVQIYMQKPQQKWICTRQRKSPGSCPSNSEGQLPKRPGQILSPRSAPTSTWL